MSKQYQDGADVLNLDTTLVVGGRFALQMERSEKVQEVIRLLESSNLLRVGSFLVQVQGVEEVEQHGRSLFVFDCHVLWQGGGL